MLQKEYRTDDKSKWPRGEWDDEPDKMQWLDEETGLPCLLHRNRCGALCGYVGVNPGHPYYGVEYGVPNEVVDVHGELTYAAFCDKDAKCEETGICHVVEEGEEACVWWLGFDCNHCWDYAPGMPISPHPPGERETYKNVAFVQAECRALARKLREVEVLGHDAACETGDAAAGDG